MKQNEPPPTCDRCGKPVKSHSVLLCDTCKGVVARIAKDSSTREKKERMRDEQK